jgi:hypothetical protein
MNKLDLKVPIEFEELENYQVDDTRFIKLKIWLMHLGENLNNSFFTEEAVTNAIPTLANTPILTYIENDDFSDHRQELEVKDGNIKISYKCNGIGVIPENNDAHFEEKSCADGVTRTFLVCNGLIWRKWDDVDDILNRDKSKKNSMELSEDGYKGHYTENGYFSFDEFKFFGTCLLGENVTPAMTGSCAEVQFSVNTNEIKNKLEQFTKFMVQSSTTEVEINKNQEGGINMAKVDNAEETPVVEPVVENTEFEANTDNTTVPEVSTSFSATYKQKREALSNALDSEIVRDADGNVVEETYYYVNDFTDEEVYVEKDHWTANDYECKYGKFAYTFDDSDLTATISGDFVEMIKVWLTKEENDLITEARTNYETVRTEYDSYKENHTHEDTEFTALTEFKAEKEKVEKEEILNRYSSKVGDKDEFVELKKKYMDYSVEDLNKECVYIRGLYADENVTKDETEPNIKFSVEQKESKETLYGGLFEKYANK